MFSTAFYYFDGGIIKQKIGVQGDLAFTNLLELL